MSIIYLEEYIYGYIIAKKRNAVINCPKRSISSPANGL